MNKYSRDAVLKRLSEGDVETKLRVMEKDLALNTVSSYSANAELYPDGQIPFVEKHIAYLMSHPSVSHDHYLANLRLMLKKRS